MSSANDSFAELMQRLRAGSEGAAQELLAQYENQVIRVVRRRLNRQLRVLFDSADFAQAVWASFFGHLSIVSQFDRPESLVAFLARVASNKVIEEGRRRLRGQKHDVQRQQSIEGIRARDGTEPAGDEPTPSAKAMALERWEQLTAERSGHELRILELRIGGATHEEIARDLGVSTKTVQRVIRKLSERLNE